MYLTEYPAEVYADAIRALNGNDRVFDALLKTRPEWAAFVNAVKGDREAVLWLLRYRFHELGVMANALNDEPKAAEWLQAQSDPFLFLFFRAAKGEPDGLSFLEQTRYKTFLPLAKAIRQ
ncbi:MAG: hypothetical protein K2H65_00645, partial [Bacteroidales bacterium]|nr:hypothetical protein [Bacteroidales bacterium]